MLDDLFHALLPPRCASCRRRGAVVCTSCAGDMGAPPVAPPPSPLTWWTACFAYEGVAREAVARAKYRGERATLARARGAVGAGGGARPHDCRHRYVGPRELGAVSRAQVSIMPRCWRAKSRAHTAGGASRCCTAGTVPGRKPGAPRLPRRAGPVLRATRRVDGLNILVIDDVATTGGTLAATARTLRAYGANCVMAATVARTPRPGRPVPERTYTSRSQLV